MPVIRNRAELVAAARARAVELHAQAEELEQLAAYAEAAPRREYPPLAIADALGVGFVNAARNGLIDPPAVS